MFVIPSFNYLILKPRQITNCQHSVSFGDIADVRQRAPVQYQSVFDHTRH